jgi:hypothetical protein
MGLVRLERVAHGRIAPKLMHGRIELQLPLTKGEPSVVSIGE